MVEHNKLDEKYDSKEIHQLLKIIEEFYNRISYSTFCWGSIGITSLINIDTYFFSSLQGTIKSLRSIVRAGQINDAYALLRKYHDSVIINTYSGLYLREELHEGQLIHEKIDSWIKGNSKLPRYGNMIEYIKKSKLLDELNKILYKDDSIEHIRDRCNDHMHYNFYYYALLNDSNIYFKERNNLLNILYSDILLIFAMHFVYMFTVNGHYMMSSDYYDYLDMGDKPPLDSEYWVSPFIQEIFDKIIKPNFVELSNIFKNLTSMKIK